MTTAPESRRSRPALSTSWICLLLVGLAAQPATATDSSDHPYQIPRIDARPSVDGRLDEPAWDDAWSLWLEYEVRPGENTPAPVRTEVLVYHDRSRIYVGFRAFDPEPSQIRAHLSDRDQATDDDWVGVVFDTFNDERRNYVFIVNPLGVQYDSIEMTGNGSMAWDGIWKSAATITEWGWSAELEIPFSTLRFQRREGPQVWGFDASRMYPRSLAHQMGTFPRDRNNNCYLCQALKIQGFAGASPGRNLEVVPTLTASRTDHREEISDGAMAEGDLELDLGATARWGVTPNLTLSGTINPDFSQVEADALQLSVNRPFSIFFPELRPFFMEGADFFDTSMNVVYTRMMREPEWGLKLTGKEGRHTVGVYVVEDEITNLIIPGSESSAFTVLDQPNTAVVARYKLDIGNRFTLGGIVTSRSGLDYSNEVAGFDADLRLSQRDRVLVQLVRSATSYPAEIADQFDQSSSDLEDWATELYYSHETRTWSWWAVLADVGTDFRADLGFMPQVDYQHREAGIGYQWNATDTSWYSLMDLKAKVAHTVDQTGGLLFHEDAIQFTIEGPIQSHSVVRPSRVREGYNGEEFDFNRLRLHFCGKPNGDSYLWLNLTAGGQVDYANTQPGDFVNFDGGLWYHFGRHLHIEPRFTRERMEVDGGWLYTSSIAELEASWQFNPRLFVRAIVQHVGNDFNTRLYSDNRDSEQQDLYTQFLVSYKLNPRTVFFVGYSDASAANQAYGLTRTDRTFFAKIGYAWVL